MSKQAEEEIDRLTNRHIAKLMFRLGDTVSPSQESEIKRQFRFFANDVKNVNKGDKREQRMDQAT